MAIDYLNKSSFVIVGVFASLATTVRLLKSKTIILGIDIPSDRSSHSHPTPRGGEVGIVVGSWIGWAASIGNRASTSADNRELSEIVDWLRTSKAVGDDLVRRELRRLIPEYHPSVRSALKTGGLPAYDENG